MNSKSDIDPPNLSSSPIMTETKKKEIKIEGKTLLLKHNSNKHKEK